MEIILESLLNEWEGFLRAAPRIGFGLLVFFLVVVIGRLAGRALSLVLARANSPRTHREFFRKVVVWAFAFFGLSITLNIVGLQGVASGLLTGGGVTAVVLGFAFREIGENFLAGFFLAFSRPFRQGDLIKTGDLEGVVTKTEIRSTRIRTAEGSDVFIPSSQLFKNPLVNYTLDGLRRLSFTLGIDYRDDPEAACRLILSVINGNERILDDPAPFAGIDALEANYQQLVATFWIDALSFKGDLRQLKSDLMNQCRISLLDHGYTVSAEVSTNLGLRVLEKVSIEMPQSLAAPSGAN